jgi:nucleotide-binding universal stress UspA family protein
MMAKRILCPIDFSKHSDAALAYASTLAHQARAKLLLVYVDDTQIPYDAGFSGYVPPPYETEQLEKQLNEIRPTIEEVECEHHLLFGHPADAIVGFAKAHDIDLIVMGTHGRTGVARLLMGSVAESVVRRAECPVLTLRQPSPTLQDSAETDHATQQ